VEQEIEQKLLAEVRVKEMHMERKIRLVYPTRRALSHAAKAFLEVVGDHTQHGDTENTEKARRKA
jgi:DNA-binding transcriptional LysR family regulator